MKNIITLLLAIFALNLGAANCETTNAVTYKASTSSGRLVITTNTKAILLPEASVPVTDYANRQAALVTYKLCRYRLYEFQGSHDSGKSWSHEYQRDEVNKMLIGKDNTWIVVDTYTDGLFRGSKIKRKIFRFVDVTPNTEAYRVAMAGFDAQFRQLYADLAAIQPGQFTQAQLLLARIAALNASIAAYVSTIAAPVN